MKEKYAKIKILQTRISERRIIMKLGRGISFALSVLLVSATVQIPVMADSELHSEAETISGQESIEILEAESEAENDIESIAENNIETDIEMSEQEELDASNTSLSTVSSFHITDVNSGNSVLVNPQDGKYAIYVFGGIGSCSNTSQSIQAINSVLGYVDDAVNVYIVDIKGNSDSTIKSAAGSLSSNVHVGNSSSQNLASTLYNKCYTIAKSQGAITGSSYTMPLIAYKSTSGEVVSTSTGAVASTEVMDALENMGVQTSYDTSLQNFNITGYQDYEAAYEILDLVNAERAKKGLSALVMDEELLSAAMYRAAECSIYYSHTRPNETTCFTINDKWAKSSSHGENIAAGQWSAASVMDSWINSSGHYANIMGSSYKSIGIGAFKIGGVYFWVQCFSSDTAATASQHTNAANTYNVIGSCGLGNTYISSTTASLEMGAATQLQVYQQNAGWTYITTPINADTYRWSSSSAAVSVDQNGKVTAVSDGTAVITATNIYNNNVKVTYTISVNNSGWVKNKNGTYSYYKNGTIVKDKWVTGTDGQIRYVNKQGIMVTNEFAFDGSYTYYLQADGSPMKDRLTYHPDGEHIIYFDSDGHEVFQNFQYCPSVGYTCYFDSQGYIYKDQITFVGDKVYYLDENGRMKQNEWFSFANGRDVGYAEADGTLRSNGFGYDPWGRVVFYHWNGMVARGLISDGAYYYSMDTTDGHYLGQFPVQ
jgi:uncharacterized protein YkwD